MATPTLTRHDAIQPPPALWSSALQFGRDALDSVLHGGPAYHGWMALLTFLMCCGAYGYSLQLDYGLSVTGMHDHVSWGLYISNFTFLVGVAAAAVVLVLPTYVLHDVDFKKAVLVGEAMAVSAVVTALGFVVVDIGGPMRMWHMIPIIGVFNWPQSMLAWDVIVLNGYFALNFSIPLYILFSHYRGLEPDKKIYVPALFVSIAWAVSLHLVTAFLYAGLPARPHWNSALLGPRFLATAFAAGPALIILVLQAIDRMTDYRIREETIRKLALVVTVAAQISMVMTISELFTEFYRTTHHSLSSQYLWFGLHGKAGLRPWLWTSLGMCLVATAILSLHPLRRHHKTLNLACVLLFVGILIEKGLGTIVPGFVPEPWGHIDEYLPTPVELVITLGLWAMGAFAFTLLCKVGIPVELGQRRAR